MNNLEKQTINCFYNIMLSKLDGSKIKHLLFNIYHNSNNTKSIICFANRTDNISIAYEMIFLPEHKVNFDKIIAPLYFKLKELTIYE